LTNDNDVIARARYARGSRSIANGEPMCWVHSPLRFCWSAEDSAAPVPH